MLRGAAAAPRRPRCSRLFESFSRWASATTEDEAFRALERMGKEIHGPSQMGGGRWQSRAAIAELPPRPFGRTEYGTHHICANRTYAQPCVALTYGVQNDYTLSWTCASVWDATCLRWIPQSTTMPSSPTASTGRGAPSPGGIDPSATGRRQLAEGAILVKGTGACAQGHVGQGAWEFEPLAPRP